MVKKSNLVLFIILLITSCEFPRELQTGSKPLTKQNPYGKVISLNGYWELAEGFLNEIPLEFPAKVKVPGLIKSAVPKFNELGVESNLREVFYYRKNIKVDQLNDELLFLKINKAKYTTKVFVNKKEVGYNPLNFTPSVFDITNFVKQNQTNEIVIGIGAHISNAPDTVNTCGEVEKYEYHPGIYDEVSLVFTKKCFIENVQIAPDIDQDEVGIVLYLKNIGEKAQKNFTINIYDPQGKNILATKETGDILMEKNSERQLKIEIPFNDYQLWTPESPVLYKLSVGDSHYHFTSHFGMRKFRVDKNYTNRALLNNKQYFLRGTNVSTFRFFEDTLCQQQVWDTVWVREFHKKLKELNLNSYRSVVCALPEFWYDIADEEGIIIFDEFPMWYAIQPEVSSGNIDMFRRDPLKKWGIYPKGLTTERLVNEYSQWMKQHWNHASVCAWDAQNETWSIHTGEAINIVRKLDYSDRPWDNGWSPPSGENDYREGHQYLARYNVGSEDKRAIKIKLRPFQLADLKDTIKIPRTFYLPYQMVYQEGIQNGYWDTPCVLNEYGYLWLNRDGSPTILTKPYYDEVLGKNATADQRFYHYARMLAALTEYWRSNRTCFGVLFPFALAHSTKNGATADIFSNIDKLELYPYFEEFVADAFYPLGISIHNWGQKYFAGSETDLQILLTNDFDTVKEGLLVINIREGNQTILSNENKYLVNGFEQEIMNIKMNLPKKSGEYLLSAEIIENGQLISCFRDIVVK